MGDVDCGDKLVIRVWVPMGPATFRMSDTDRYDDRLVVRTNLIEAYDLLSDFAKRHLPDRFVLDGDVFRARVPAARSAAGSGQDSTIELATSIIERDGSLTAAELAKAGARRGA